MWVCAIGWVGWGLFPITATHCTSCDALSYFFRWVFSVGVLACSNRTDPRGWGRGAQTPAPTRRKAWLRASPRRARAAGKTTPFPCVPAASAAKDTAFAVAGAMPCAMCACAVLPMVLPQATELLGCCCTRPRARPGAPSSQRRRTVVLLHFPPHCFAGASVGMQGGCQRIHRTGVSYRCPADLTAIDIGAPSAPAPARPKRRHLGRFGQVWSSLWCHDAPPTPRHSPPTCPRRPVEQHTSGVCFLYELGC